MKQAIKNLKNDYLKGCWSDDSIVVIDRIEERLEELELENQQLKDRLEIRTEQFDKYVERTIKKINKYKKEIEILKEFLCIKELDID